GDYLRTKSREEARLVGVGIAPHDALPAGPSRIYDLQQVGIGDECLVRLVDGKRGMPLLDRAVESRGADADAQERAPNQKADHAAERRFARISLWGGDEQDRAIGRVLVDPALTNPESRYEGEVLWHRQVM